MRTCFSYRIVVDCVCPYIDIEVDGSRLPLFRDICHVETFSTFAPALQVEETAYVYRGDS